MSVSEWNDMRSLPSFSQKVKVKAADGSIDTVWASPEFKAEGAKNYIAWAALSPSKQPEPEPVACDEETDTQIAWRLVEEIPAINDLGSQYQEDIQAAILTALHTPLYTQPSQQTGGGGGIDRAAVQRLILAADSYGVRYLDSDFMTEEAEELQAAAEAMKDTLAALSTPEVG